MVRPRRPLRIAVLICAVLSFLTLVVSTGAYSLHFTPRTELVIRRGALELAFASHCVQSSARDSWMISEPAGVPGIGVCLPPRTFWYPTTRHETHTYPSQNLPPNHPPWVMHLTLIQIPLALPTLLLLLLAAWLWLPICSARPPALV